MTLRPVLTGAVAAGLLAAAVGPAIADEDPGAEPAQRSSEAYWSVTMHGGALVPLLAMNDTHQISLVAGARVGWTSRIGLGLELSGTYAPLSRRPTDEVTAETHYGTLTFGPRYTLGHGLVRGTIAVGGGMAGERTRLIQGDVALTTTTFTPVAEGRLGLELHVIDGGGLTFGASYTQTFDDEPYRYASVGGGLMLTF